MASIIYDPRFAPFHTTERRTKPRHKAEGTAYAQALLDYADTLARRAITYQPSPSQPTPRAALDRIAGSIPQRPYVVAD